MVKEQQPAKAKIPKKKSKQPHLETADDFLATGVELEESAEKWRAGDATKSARFYIKAIDCYAAGLEQFPASFDLEYNRARAQYAITQYPLLRDQFPLTTPELLEIALQSHRKALVLSPHNADVLFNTAQVLSSMADSLPNDSSSDSALKLLDEAVHHLGACFDLQKASFLKREEMLREVSLQDPSEKLRDSQDEPSSTTSAGIDSSTQDSSWAFIEEPVTAATLIDTSVALAEALTAYCQAAADRGSVEKLSVLEQSTQMYIQEKSQMFIDLVERSGRVEACCARARLKCALLDAAFNMSQVGVVNYDDGVAAVFGAEATLIAANQPNFLIAYAECLQDFVVSTADVGDASSKRWQRLEKALALLTCATEQTKDLGELSVIHNSRGDVEMLRLSISLSAQAPASLAGESVKKTLIQNAQKFYKGAKLCAQGVHGSSARQSFETAQIKEAIASAIYLGGNGPLKEIQSAGVPDESIKSVLKDISDDLLLPKETLQSSGLF